MLANSKRFINYILPPAIRYLKPSLNLFTRPPRNMNFKSSLIVGCTLLMGLSYINAIEDETIRNLKSIMNRQINQLRS